jgi:tight adherence protein C
MPLELIIATAGAFIAVSLIVATTMSSLLMRHSVARRRLEQMTGGPSGAPAAVPVILAEQPTERAERLSRLVPKSTDTKSRLQKRLARAGYQGAWPAILYSACELGLPIVFGAIPLYLMPWPKGPVLAAFVALIAYMLPGFFLAWKIEQRQTIIRNALPDALDLMIVCVEAGLSLDQAIQKTSEEIDLAHPVLAMELRTVMTEIRAGKPRLEAIKNFAQRTKVDDVQSLVALLVQTDRFGTSVAQALRIFADTARTKRRQRAEEKAQKLGVKLVFPLVFCLFPALYVVTLGPAVIQFVRVFFGVVAAP